MSVRRASFSAVCALFVAVAAAPLACTYVIAPLDEVRVYDGGITGDVGSPDTTAPDTTAPDDGPKVDSTPEAAMDVAPETPSCSTVFTPLATRTNVGANSTETALGDMNGDGKLDLVATSRLTNKVQVMLGVGDGSFGAPATFASGANPLGVALGDLNGDGKLDVVATATDPLMSAVSVFLGNGDGTLGARTNLPSSGGAAAVSLTDLNNDGKLDLVWTNGSDDTLTVRLGNGDGTFQPQTDLPTPKGPWQVVAGKLDADANLDLVVFSADPGSGSRFATVRLGNGDGSFKAGVDYALDDNPSVGALTDLNGDGKLDLVVIASGTSFSDRLNVLLGKGDGTLLGKVAVTTAPFPTSLRVGDFDRDGKVDLAVAVASDGSIALHRGKGDGTFAAFEKFTTFADAVPIALQAADLDKNGALDLVAIDDVFSKTITMLGCK